MIYALISDVHGNLEALTAVMEDIRNHNVDEILFLGDAVGYGANPNEVLKIIREECKVKIMGNHDYSALGLLDPSEFNIFAQSAILYSSSILTDESKSILSSFRMSQSLGDIFLVHATPDSPESWSYCLSVADAESQFDAFSESICFIGHSHQPAAYQRNQQSGRVEQIYESQATFGNNEKHIVNIGSVGQPRDNDPRACYVTFDSISQRLQFRRVAYDIFTAQAKMRAVELPPFLIERLASGR